jgi:Xaa-Pro aminopeptidase
MAIVTREALALDLRRRVAAVQALMEEQDLCAVVAVATGAPSQTGWLHYLTAAELYDGQACIMVAPGRAEPLVVLATPAQAEEVALSAVGAQVTSGPEADAHHHWPGAPEGTVRQAARVLADLTAGRGRVGTVAFEQLRHPDHRHLREALPDVEWVDVTGALNRIRMVKSPVEVEALREMGRILSAALDLFEERARPGRSAWEVAGEVEGMLRSRGCFWGTSKYSFDDRPYLFPVAPERRFHHDDAMVFEFVYSGPPGYWYILSSLYSFRPLPAATERRLRATEAAIREIARVAVPGSTCANLRDASDRAFREHGLEVVGRHTVDCHPIGTDINDGPGDMPWGAELCENMSLAVHPASLLEGGRGFFLCEIFLVQDGGAVPLSPRRAFYRLLDRAR